ncbi:MAG: glycosyl hydrolase family 28 protein [Breznakibacter sp.]
MYKSLLFIVLFCSITGIHAREFVITKHGVGLDSTRLSTRAIQKVIDKAHAKGGGTVVVPKGIFLTGALFFKPNTHLKLMEGAVLKGSDNIADYPLVPSRMEGKKLDYYAALINAYKVDGFTISGPGMINGNGEKFWKTFWAYRDSLRKIDQEATNLDVHRPRLVFVWGCNNVSIQDVKLYNSGFWTTHLYQCNDVVIENCDIRSPYKPIPAPSTDGIDIDVCKGVTVRNCYIAVNDDAVCIKGGKGPFAHRLPENGVVEDVLVEGCTFGPSHGTLTLGSECIHARNITVRNCKVENNCPILRLKMRPDTYQTYENITIENIVGACGSIIEMKPWRQFFDLEGSSEQPYAVVRHISMSNIHVKCDRFGVMEGNGNDSVYAVMFRDIQAQTDQEQFDVEYENVVFDNVFVNRQKLGSRW